VGRKRSGFTLIELLVVIAIIAILAAILFPMFVSAKNKASQTKCMNNMVQIGRAMNMYADDYHGYLPFAWNTIDKNWSVWDRDTWRERIEKYVKNRKVLICPIPTAKPPAQYKKEIGYIGHYGICVYVVMDDAAVNYIGTRMISSIPHPSQTILVTENKDGDWSGEPYDNGSTGDAGEFYPYHGDGSTKGGEFIFCDGHAAFMPVSKTQENNFFYWKVIKK